MIIFGSMQLPLMPVYLVQKYVIGRHWKIKRRKKYEHVTPETAMTVQSITLAVFETAIRNRKRQMLNLIAKLDET